MLPLFISSVVTFFLVVEPIGNSVYFAAATGGQSRARRMQQALLGLGVAAIIVPLFTLFGLDFLALLHIDLPAFQISGGLFILLIAIKLVLGQGPGEGEDAQAKPSTRSIAVFPLAVPMLAGPATLTAALLLVSGEASYEGAWPAELVVLAGFAVVMVLTLAIFSAASWVTEFVQGEILSALNAIIGMLLGAFAIEFIVSGIFGAIAIHSSGLLH